MVTAWTVSVVAITAAVAALVLVRGEVVRRARRRSHEAVFGGDPGAGPARDRSRWKLGTGGGCVSGSASGDPPSSCCCCGDPAAVGESSTRARDELDPGVAAAGDPHISQPRAIRAPSAHKRRPVARIEADGSSEGRTRIEVGTGFAPVELRWRARSSEDPEPSDSAQSRKENPARLTESLTARSTVKGVSGVERRNRHEMNTKER